MNLSYWEYKSWFSNVDFTVVGSGIVGLNCALALRERHPESKILVLERGLLPHGASTRNAGFACFGSLSEILDDLKTHTEEEVFKLVERRWSGLQLLRKNLGDAAIDYQQNGGHELFLTTEKDLLWNCLTKRKEINEMLRPIFREEVYFEKENHLGFKKCLKSVLFTPFEGQIDTGKMMRSLLKKAAQENILILNSFGLASFSDDNDKVVFLLENGMEFTTSKLFIATNGFAGELLEEDVKPARSQVLVTSPIKNLKVKGTFHFDRGFYYFRNVEDRVLFGGGRNLDLQTEETSEMKTTCLIQGKLEELLAKIILPGIPFEIEHRWSGIMGVGDKKVPVIRQISENVYCGVRLGGMGVAIGSEVGRELAAFLD